MAKLTFWIASKGEYAVTTALKMIALILSLGIDTLIMSASLGLIKTTGKLKMALVFACAEALVPLIGLLIGKSVSYLIGDWASLAGGIALVGLGIWLIFFDDENEDTHKLERKLVGWTLVGTVISISLDEFTIGFSIGLIGVPIVLTLILIALQSFVFTSLGLTFGSKLKPFLGERSEKLAGTVLGLLGLWILVDVAFPSSSKFSVLS
jgi:putative Mn2+ efflux pump MntP